ncbi:50S ribosomal protein L4 [Terribacillus saccharophilus]|jgi:large subunit ribosomal protein L4|uniref:Large ribosomal subunit protein uL4 n=1 Tax=Terribacillus saccharophilus TaxID=361277 RepID=A0A1H8MET2_9BACI|nr:MULTISPECIES: 50S ribosomal protein L4 [Terribacillus]AIF68303.1 50S ribosomal protein L4 [Terribacillus goriensis]MCM3227435.1 50S ribosomal protein L4 [Terribacillus saccharophilus]MEC0284546.1 50S ribosomal protein L4 [Terribacillus saccharophilus]MEC0292232.1 50S ribosomal protein L4 [Terribacillus saccharophilus]MEC0303533.1 50S ribosomal protein L4 [Terribacillus saccharophilus]
MPKVALFNQSGSQVGEIELNDSVFGIEPHTHVLHEAVLMQRASMRQGTHKVKGRSEVRGGGRKPWRQKGTGRARQGSIRSPQWVGGGTVFGPTPRSYSYKLPKKVRRLALKSALSSKVQEENIVVLESLAFDAPKTKDVVAMLNALNVDKKVLIVTADKDETVVRSANNLKNVKVLKQSEVNVLDLLTHDKLILTKEAAEKAGEVLA